VGSRASPPRLHDDDGVLRPENRWLAALTLLWLVVPVGLLRLGRDLVDSLDEPPGSALRTLPLVLLAGTVVLVSLHVRANAGLRPVLKAVVATVVLGVLGWAAWIWTIDGHRGSGPVMAVPLCLNALVVGALAGSRAAARA
jgi:hypothetical protein